MPHNSTSSDELRFETLSARDTEALGRRVGALLGSGDVVLLDGPLGAGKTTLARGLAAGLGVDEAVTSPTYTIVHSYTGRVPVAHLDLYRLDTVGELEDLGLDELLGGEGVLVVEWGGVVDAVFGTDRLEIELRYGDPGTETARTIVLRPAGASWRGRLEGIV